MSMTQTGYCCQLSSEAEILAFSDKDQY